MRSPTTLNVHKFGGAALADADAIRRVIAIIAGDEAKKVIVASAMLGVTDELFALVHSPAAAGFSDTTLDRLRQKHVQAALALGLDGEAFQAELAKSFDELK